MNKQQKEIYEHAIKTLSKYYNDNSTITTEYLLKLLHRHEVTLNRYFTKYCNGELTPEEWEKVNNIELRVVKLLKQFNTNIKIDFNQDPRGACIQMFLPNKEYNSWDGETYRIHW